MGQLTDQQLYEAHLLLHRLWSRSVGQEGYEKTAWTRFEWLLSQLIGKQMGTEQTGGWLAQLQERLPPVIQKEIGQRVRGRYEGFPCDVPEVPHDSEKR